MAPKEWLRGFKVALIEDDEAALARLAGRMPRFEEYKEMLEAQALIEEARRRLMLRRDRVATEMRELETARKFLTSGAGDEGQRLDIRS